MTTHRINYIANEAETDAILIAFADAGEGADLADWTRRHPEHARSLARLAAERRLPAATEAASADPSADARILAVGRAALAAARAQRTAERAPLISLLAAARTRGLDAAGVAHALDLPVACFWKLHRRLFAPDSLPRALVARLAETLDRTQDDIAAYLRRPPTLAAGANYKADAAPALGAQEDFAQSLAGDPELTDVQRARWLASPTEEEQEA